MKDDGFFQFWVGAMLFCIALELGRIARILKKQGGTDGHS